MRNEVFVVVAFVIASKVIVDIVNYIQHASRALRLGCKPAPQQTSLFLGIDQIIDMIKADWTMRLPDSVLESFEKMRSLKGGPVYTYRQYQLGETSFITCDPKNVQAMLASQFHDFDLGSNRRNAFHKLLGTGIVR